MRDAAAFRLCWCNICPREGARQGGDLACEITLLAKLAPGRAARLSALATPASALEPGKAFHDYASDTWSLEQGLPQITVLSINQGPNGYMWFGTQDGLARFDGVTFKPYLPGNWIRP